jgi:hypothetical protein
MFSFFKKSKPTAFYNPEGGKKPTVFIHTNYQQLVGAKVAEYSLKTRSRHADKFDIKIINNSDFPFLLNKKGQKFMRKGVNAEWTNDDLQSFTPLRFLPPELMGFKNRAVVIDPDVFAVGDIYELLTRDMKGKAILARSAKTSFGSGAWYGTSVMLMDCEKLKHWDWEKTLNNMFKGTFDYGNWVGLRLENPDTIGLLEEEWNHFDTLAQNTKLIHMTERSTQPWKTGLPIDFDRMHNASAYTIETYQPHPDPLQELFFLSLLKEALEKDFINKAFVQEHVDAQNVRSDVFEKLAHISGSFDMSALPAI